MFDASVPSWLDLLRFPVLATGLVLARRAWTTRSWPRLDRAFGREFLAAALGLTTWMALQVVLEGVLSRGSVGLNALPFWILLSGAALAGGAFGAESLLFRPHAWIRASMWVAGSLCILGLPWVTGRASLPLSITRHSAPALGTHTLLWLSGNRVMAFGDTLVELGQVASPPGSRLTVQHHEGIPWVGILTSEARFLPWRSLQSTGLKPVLPAPAFQATPQGLKPRPRIWDECHGPAATLEGSQPTRALWVGRNPEDGLTLEGIPPVHLRLDVPLARWSPRCGSLSPRWATFQIGARIALWDLERQQLHDLGPGTGPLLLEGNPVW